MRAASFFCFICSSGPSFIFLYRFYRQGKQWQCLICRLRSSFSSCIEFQLVSFDAWERASVVINWWWLSHSSFPIEIIGRSCCNWNTRRSESTPAIKSHEIFKSFRAGSSFGRYIFHYCWFHLEHFVSLGPFQFRFVYRHYFIHLCLWPRSTTTAAATGLIEPF